MMGYCRKCGVLLNVGHNWAESHAKRKQRICKPCNAEQARQWRKDNPHKQKEYSRKRGRWWIESRYGITQKEWQEKFDEQEGRCALCGTDDPKGNHGVFHVDHCHATGKVRGLLCDTCNRGLGFFYDDVELLQAAKEYLEDHK
mgnify:CR=1 FL=1